MGVLFGIALVLGLLPGNVNSTQHYHRVGTEARNLTLLLAYVGVMMVYLALFTPRGYVERSNERLRERSNRDRGLLPEWGLPGRLFLLAAGVWLAWWQGGELLAYLHH
jgi:hypothetical protein